MHVCFRQMMSRSKIRGHRFFSKRQCSTALVPTSELIERGNYLFSQEQKRQLENVGRVEKITVEVAGPPQDLVLVMNQNISTPYDCCKHISLPLCQRTPLAVLNEKILWDMHRPLPGNCKLKFLSFRDKSPYSLNHVFWRTGSFILGAVIKRAFKEEAGVLLHSFPAPMVSSGSFIYDVDMKLNNWIPTHDEIKILSAEFLKFVLENHKIERLCVKKSVAAEIFTGNPHKLAEIPKLAREAEDHLVPLYRVGDHIDMSYGPMVADTSFFGRCSVAAVHIVHNLDIKLYRFQGVALPKGIMLNSYAFGIIHERAKRLNEAFVPDLPEEFQHYDTSGMLPTKPSDEKVRDDPFIVDLK